MTTEPVIVRPARPTLDEGRQFARYLNVAADGVFRVLLGPRFDRIIAEAYLSPGHDLSYETAVFAERNGTIAGMASAYSAEQHHQSSDEPLKKAAGVRSWRMAALALLGRRVLAFIDTVPSGDFYLQAVAVDEAHRGAGIGSILMDDAERRALAEGCRRLALDVAQSNESARRLYERRGMTIEATSPSIFFAPGSGANRMTKDL